LDKTAMEASHAVTASGVQSVDTASSRNSVKHY